MLSQQIAKDLLKLTVAPDTITTRELRSSVAAWKRSQQDLIGYANTPRVKELFQSIEQSHQLMVASADSLVNELEATGSISATTLQAAQRTILKHESIFLEGMDAIVEQYAREAHDRVASLSVMEYVLVGISLLVIFFEVIFVFRPTALQVTQAVDRLTDSEKNAHKLSKEIGALYASLEKSYHQMAIVNQPVDNPKLYAKG